MAEEVEITNYGKGGVASEETLVDLVKTMERLAKSKGFDPKEVTKKTKDLSKSMKDGIVIIDKNRKALDKHTDAVDESASRLSKGLGAVGAGLGSFANRLTSISNELLFGGSALTDFTKEIPVIGSLLSPLTQIIDTNVEIYREFSSIGGTAAKELFDFSKIAADAGIPMNDFRQLVMENSHSMKLFGDTTTVGMKNLAALSEEFREGPGRSLMQLGFTSNELNQTLVDLAELNSNMFTMGRVRDRITQRSAAEYANTLFDLAAITGKRRDQLVDEMKQASSDYRARVAMASMDEDQRKRFQANMTIGGSAMQDALLDMADGIPQSDLAQRLSAMSSLFREKSRDIEDMDPREMNNFMFGVRTEMENFAAANKTTIQALAEGDAGIRGILDFTEQSKDLRFLSEEAYNKQQADKAQMQTREDLLLQFNEDLNKFRTGVQGAFIDSGILQVITDASNNILKTLGDEEVMNHIKEGLTSLSSSISNFLEAFKEDPKKAINDALSGIGQGLKDILFGGEREIDTLGGKETVLTDGIFKGLGTSVISAIISGIATAMDNDSIADEIALGIGALFLVGGPVGLALKAGIATLFAGASVAKAMANGATSLFEKVKKSPAAINPNQLLDKNGKPLAGTAKDARIAKLNREMAMPETKNNKSIAKILGALLKGGGKFIPGVGLVIAGGAGAYDAVTGFNADPEAGLGESTVNALSSLINGLTFGLFGSNSSEISNRSQTNDVTQETPNVSTTNGLNDISVEKLEKLSATSPGIERLAGAFERIGAVQGLQENMASFQADLKLTDMMNFNAQLSEMGENFKEINRQLSKDNKFGLGNGVNAGSLFENNGSSQGIDPQIIKDLNSTLSELVGHERNEVAYLRQISKNTGAMPSDVSKVPTNVSSRGRNSGRSGR